MPTPELSAWRKSSRSSPNNGDCVEVGFGADIRGVRDTKNRSYGTLVFGNESWSSFLGAVKSGRLDLDGNQS
ncbi:DUF397 domain-containing protein [Saccharopolyspora hattusasensis]|uniref:DUF397 domain-containing protein n=1 Tax=Saccharopolyspora hattusasensis TaxID=1128679 RepID=UPI003D98D2CB